jgi:cytochrome d ubiquinol oxidase subunit II
MIWTPLAFDRIAARWFSAPNIYFLWPVPLLTALTALMRWALAQRGARDASVLRVDRPVPAWVSRPRDLDLSLSRPPALTLWQTAAVPTSQLFMLTGTLILLPIILGYSVYVYWIFRGKVRAGEGYH